MLIVTIGENGSFFGFRVFKLKFARPTRNRFVHLDVRPKKKEAEPRDKTKLSDSPRSLPVFISNHLQLINIENR